MRRIKQKVYIVIEYPIDSENGRILKVFGNIEGAETFVQRKSSLSHTLHIVKKSVQGTQVSQFKVRGRRVIDPGFIEVLSGNSREYNK